MCFAPYLSLSDFLRYHFHRFSLHQKGVIVKAWPLSGGAFG